LIPLPSKFWYVRALDQDGWDLRHKDYTGSSIARGGYVQSREVLCMLRGLVACSRGYKLRSREGAGPKSLGVVVSV
jgi:hypothetical protein